MAVAVPSSGERGELIERLLHRDRQVVAGGLLLVTTLAWWYLLAGAGMDMGAMDMSMPIPWSAGYALLVFLMWWVMMGLLFYGGVMNLYWITGIAALVLVDKLLPAGEYLGRAGGIVFIAWGLWLLI